MKFYVILNNESHVYGVRLNEVDAEKLRSEEQEKLEYQGSNLRVRVCTCLTPTSEDEVNKIITPKNILEFVFNQGRQYEAGELELDTEGRTTAFEVWYENYSSKK